MVDVLNEAVNAPLDASQREALGGDGATGYDWVVAVYEMVREACPSSDLILNEYNLLAIDSVVADFVDLANVLKSRNLLDGIGI